MPAIAEALLEEVNAKEDLAVRLGDTLDMKASIGLAVIIFLATQSAYFLDKGLMRFPGTMQIFSIVCSVVAGMLALAELWPREYILPQPESDYIQQRIAELTKHYSPYPDVEVNVANQLTHDEIKWAKERIANNQKTNHKKSMFLEWSFWFTGAAVTLNLLTAMTFIQHLF